MKGSSEDVFQTKATVRKTNLPTKEVTYNIDLSVFLCSPFFFCTVIVTDEKITVILASKRPFLDVCWTWRYIDTSFSFLYLYVMAACQILVFRFVYRKLIFDLAFCRWHASWTSSQGRPFKEIVCYHAAGYIVLSCMPRWDFVPSFSYRKKILGYLGFKFLLCFFLLSSLLSKKNLWNRRIMNRTIFSKNSVDLQNSSIR